MKTQSILEWIWELDPVKPRTLGTAQVDEVQMLNLLRTMSTNLELRLKPLNPEKGHSEKVKYSNDGFCCNDPDCQWCRRANGIATGREPSRSGQADSNRKTHPIAALLSRASRYFRKVIAQ